MNPNNQTQISPEQPTNPVIETSPQVVAQPAAQYLYQPGGPVSQPTTAINQPVLSAKAHTNMKRISITAIIIGVLLIMLGGLLGLFVNIVSFINIPIGIIYLVYALKLRKPGVSIEQIVSACKVIDITVLVGFVLGIIFGAGAGILQLLLVIFTTNLIVELYNTGLITTKSPLTAKLKV